MDYFLKNKNFLIILFFIIIIGCSLVIFIYKKYSATTATGQFVLNHTHDDSVKSTVTSDYDDDENDDDDLHEDFYRLDAQNEKDDDVVQGAIKVEPPNREINESCGEKKNIAHFTEEVIGNKIRDLQSVIPSSSSLDKNEILDLDIKKRQKYTIHSFPSYFNVNSNSITMLNIMQKTYFNNAVIKFYKDKFDNYDNVLSISPLYEININGYDSFGKIGAIKINNNLIESLPSTSDNGIPLKSLKIQMPSKKSDQKLKQNAVCSLIIKYNDIEEILPLKDMPEFNAIFIHKSDLNSPVWLKMK